MSPGTGRRRGRNDVVERNFQRVGDLAECFNVADFMAAFDLRKEALRDADALGERGLC
jgi:hypothetical protein